MKNYLILKQKNIIREPKNLKIKEYGNKTVNVLIDVMVSNTVFVSCDAVFISHVMENITLELYKKRFWQY